MRSLFDLVARPLLSGSSPAAEDMLLLRGRFEAVPSLLIAVVFVSCGFGDGESTGASGKVGGGVGSSLAETEPALLALEGAFSCSCCDGAPGETGDEVPGPP